MYFRRKTLLYMPLGEFSYRLDSSNAQTFQPERSANPQAFNLVRFDFSSNHGNFELTCIFRFRVHPCMVQNLAPSAMQHDALICELHTRA